jgi:chemotaxis protein methyltransferase CheR
MSTLCGIRTESFEVSELSVTAFEKSYRELPALNDADFEAVREMAWSACGISLSPTKRALVASRLEKLVRRHGFDSFGGYVAFLSGRRHGDEFSDFIDTLTTNHTGFWREPEHFAFLQKEVFPHHRTRLRIWSSACATGEEPYNIAMCALEAGIANCVISASDISRTALGAAREATYDSAKLALLPTGWAERYFQRRDAPGGLQFRPTEAVRRMVQFASLNLLHPFPQVGLFDVIFCRNVMIYFEQPTRDELVHRLAQQLAPGGYLFTGHSETLLHLPESLEYARPATYRRR